MMKITFFIFKCLFFHHSVSLICAKTCDSADHCTLSAYYHLSCSLTWNLPMTLSLIKPTFWIDQQSTRFRWVMRGSRSWWLPSLCHNLSVYLYNFQTLICLSLPYSTGWINQHLLLDWYQKNMFLYNIKVLYITAVLVFAREVFNQ